MTLELCKILKFQLLGLYIPKLSWNARLSVNNSVYSCYTVAMQIQLDLVEQGIILYTTSCIVCTMIWKL